MPIPSNFTRQDSLSPDPPTSVSFSSNGSFDYNSHQDEVDIPNDDEEDDLEIVLDSTYGKGVASSHRLPSDSLAQCGDENAALIGLGVSVSSGSSVSEEEEYQRGQTVTCIGSVPSFKFSLPPSSPTKYIDVSSSPHQQTARPSLGQPE